VIHVVGPNYLAGQRDPELLASCYREAVRIADDLGVRTMALPAVSAGIYGWPLHDAARVAVETVGARGADVTVGEARFVLFSPNVYQIFADEVSNWSRDRS
jgi:O-acetyl-ADP-ribose deacetylase (regulator of RNase III)